MRISRKAQTIPPFKLYSLNTATIKDELLYVWWWSEISRFDGVKSLKLYSLSPLTFERGGIIEHETENFLKYYSMAYDMKDDETCKL